MFTPTTEVHGRDDSPPVVQKSQNHAAKLAAELTRIETTEKAVRDRQAQEELARLRELARFD